MSINIGRFVTRCRAARQHQAVGSLADQIVRARFGAECSRRLSLMPASQSSVVRIRKLPVKLKISGARLDEESITGAWVDAFIRELLIAMNSNRVSESEIVCVKSRAEWLARFIADVISGSANGRWEYEEFQESLQLGTSHCVLSVLSRDPSEIVPVLRLLEDRNRFDQFLLLFDEFLLEKFFSLFSPANDESCEPTVDDLITIARLVTSQNISRGSLATRQHSLRIFLALSRAHLPGSDRVMNPRLVWYALLTLDKLVELTQSLPPESWFYALAPESIAQRKEPALHPVVLEVMARIWSIATSIGLEEESTKLQTLSRLVADLDPLRTVTGANSEQRARWVSCQFAGLLLLVGLIDRLGWVQRIRISSLALRLDTRAINFCLAGLALRLLGQSAEDRRPDSALLLFAGWLEPAAVNLSAFHTFLDSISETERVDLLDLLAEVGTQQKEGVRADWTATFDVLASILIREFAGRVRGFRQANPAFVVKTFFSQPGRVFIDDQRILVVLQSNPFHVALHVSSMDEPVESVSWLGGRRLEFQLEGL